MLLTSKIMNNKDQDIAYFISFCIEQYKKAKGLSGAEVMDIFVKFGVLEELIGHIGAVGGVIKIEILAG